MKVILQAFGGKLKSKPMDWPEDKNGQDIFMILDMERPSVTRSESGLNLYEIGPRKCRFEFTKGYEISKDLPAIYTLVDIK